MVSAGKSYQDDNSLLVVHLPSFQTTTHGAFLSSLGLHHPFLYLTCSLCINAFHISLNFLVCDFRCCSFYPECLLDSTLSFILLERSSMNTYWIPNIMWYQITSNIIFCPSLSSYKIWNLLHISHFPKIHLNKGQPKVICGLYYFDTDF